MASACKRRWRQRRRARRLRQHRVNRDGEIGGLDAAVVIEIQPLRCAQRLGPGEVPHQPADVEGVEHVIVTIEIAEMIVADEDHPRIGFAFERCRDRPAGVPPVSSK